jgi:hypothetical protein
MTRHVHDYLKCGGLRKAFARVDSAHGLYDKSMPTLFPKTRPALLCSGCAADNAKISLLGNPRKRDLCFEAPLRPYN